MASTTKVQFCPECEGISFVSSALPGHVSCRTCGKIVKGEIGTRDGAILSKDDGPEPEYDFDLDTADEENLTLGWRTWKIRIDATKPRLYSVSKGTYWQPRAPVEAECAHKGGPGHDPPEEACTCGLYSAKTRDHLLSMSYHFYDLEQGSLCVLGTVSLWGKVVEATQGWRAQFGYPRELFLPFEAYGHAEALREEYGVKVTLNNILAGSD